MAEVHNFLDMWHDRKNLSVTQKESHAQNKQMTTVGYISDTADIIKESWSNFQRDGAASFKMSERSTLPPALSTKNLPGGGTQVLHVRWIKSINRHPVEGDKDSTPDSISDTENWLNWNCHLDSPNDSEQDCKADYESHIEPDNCIKASESPAHWVVSAQPNVPGLIRPTWRSMKNAETGLTTISIMETRSNKGNKKK